MRPIKTGQLPFVAGLAVHGTTLLATIAILWLTTPDLTLINIGSLVGGSLGLALAFSPFSGFTRPAERPARTESVQMTIYGWMIWAAAVGAILHLVAERVAAAVLVVLPVVLVVGWNFSTDAAAWLVRRRTTRR